MVALLGDYPVVQRIRNLGGRLKADHGEWGWDRS
jgi:hypothetical protein